MTDALMPKPVDWDTTVADNVRGELARQRWTGRKAAAALGITQNYVSRRLSGLTPMSPADLVMFSDLLEVPIARFFDADQANEKATKGGAPVAYSLPDLDSNQEPTG